MKLPSLDHRWFVVRTQPRAELTAADELRLGGYQSYVPMRRVKNFKRRQRIILNHQEPLFVGYLFLASETGKDIDWGHIRDSTAYRHVGRPLRGLYGPLEIPARLVVKIHEDEVNGLYDETGATKRQRHEKLAEKFAAGTKARISEGPFSGFICDIESVTANDRIAALVDIFGRQSRVEFEPGQLEAA